MGQMKRGIVVDGRGSQVKVQFEDDDGMISPWLDVGQPSTIGKRSFRRFKKGEMVRCYLDRKGESGEAIYAIYNDVDPTPADSDDVIHEVMPDGSVFIWKSGSIFLQHASGLILTIEGNKAKIIGDLEVVGNVDFRNGHVNHNDTNIGDTHKHPESIGSITGNPQ